MAFKARPPPTFSPSSSNFNLFREWRSEFETYVAVTTFFSAEIDSVTKQARLNNLAGSDFAKFVRQNLIVDENTTIDQILDGVASCLKPKRFDLQNREKLFSLKQSHLSAVKFLEELRELYDLSNYGDTIHKNELIRDLFIAGLSLNEAKCIIHQQDSEKLTIDRSLHLVSSFESVNSSTNSKSTPDVSVCSMNNTTIRSPTSVWKCFGCGSTTKHLRSACPAFKFNCNKCGKVGHFSRVCRSFYNSNQRSINSMDTVENMENTTINSLNINSMTNNPKNKRKTITVNINNKTIPSILIDSGSDITVLSYDLCRKIKLSFQKIYQPPKVIGANGALIRLIGRIENACIETKEGILLDTVWIAENLNSEAILGNSSLSAFKALNINYGGHLPPLHIQELSTVRPKTFADCPPVSCFPEKPVNPIRAASRRQSLEDKNFIKEELRNLIQTGKIQKSNSPWRSQAFVVRESGRKPRMVIDYAQTVNRVTSLDAYPIPLVSELLEQVSQYHFFSYIDLKSAFHQFALRPDECSLTAFEADNRLWEFKCVPFGLRNSPAAFNRALQELLCDLPGLHIYMDDIVIGGKSKEEHDTNLQKFLERAKLKILPFLKRKVFLEELS